MNYKRIYDCIIERSKRRSFSWKKTDKYFERHHIIPKCFGGSNKKQNLTMLTAKEHYVCHHLLWKIYDDKRMALAFHKMKSVNNKSRQLERNFCLSPKEYEKLRIDIAKFHSSRLITDETKSKISLSQRKRFSQMTDEKRSEIKNIMKEALSNPDVKLKMSISAKGKKHWWNNKKGSIGGSNPKAKKCSICGIEFECIKDAAAYAKENFGICLSSVKKRFNDPNDKEFFKEVYDKC